MSADEILVLMAPRQRRDEIVDVLMACEALSGFSLSQAGGFSRLHAQLDLREQVQGYRDIERFEVLCAPGVRERLLEQLATMAGKDRFHYWVLPLVTQGAVGNR